MSSSKTVAYPRVFHKYAGVKYVVVKRPGTDEQEVIYSQGSLLGAIAYKATCERHGEFDVDVMKRLPDGTLTTDF